MLTRSGLVAAFALAAALLLPVSAHAGPVGGDQDTITVAADYTSERDGYDGRGGGPRVCQRNFRGTYTEVPCDDAGGWWSNTFNCYMRPAGSAGVPPRAGMVLWSCFAIFDEVTRRDSLIWLPEGQGPGPDPATVIRDRAEATLPKPAIGITPPAGSGQPGLVGLPTWLWVEGGWSPVTITATAGPMWITATATIGRSSLTLPVAGLGLAFLTLLAAPSCCASWQGCDPMTPDPTTQRSPA